MKMIVTITLNPALDKTIYVRGLAVGDTNRIERTEVDAGGKGVNASRMLVELGADAVALGFLGGRTGRFISSVLSEEGIRMDFVRTGVETRTNIDIQDLDGIPPTCLNEKGGPITLHELDELKTKVRHWAGRCEIVILGGSIPRSIEPAIYRELIDIVQAEGAKAILDADNDSLELGVLACPMMIKPNADETKRLCRSELATIDDFAAAAQSLVERGIELVVVSMGKRGAIAATKDSVWHAVPPEIKAISTVGSGDSMVAGMAVALAEGKPVEEGLALGSAAGAATAMSTGVEMGKRADVERLLPLVKLNRLR